VFIAGTLHGHRRPRLLEKLLPAALVELLLVVEVVPLVGNVHGGAGGGGDEDQGHRESKRAHIHSRCLCTGVESTS